MRSLTSILTSDNKKIGGVRHILEIDKWKFGKRNYNKRHWVEGIWMFGGIDRDTKETFYDVVEWWDVDMLIPIIQKYIIPGTTIYSDWWKAYSTLKDIGYIHSTVKHSAEFKAANRTCTNTIESTWRAVKNSLPRKRTVKDLHDSYFSDYCIRKNYFNNSDDKFLKFLELITTVYNLTSTKVDWIKKKKTENLIQPVTTQFQANGLL